ncbi:hypothetical protein [Granulicella sp. L60]|jgi:hypothetical protein|uniref:hypothetical protein n=1 Tax=Granulicella sp. L60 TaxID=1641866 RepID=UPI00131E303E|nr:hypothetical protein [Granulicella sp. L60]
MLAVVLSGHPAQNMNPSEPNKALQPAVNRASLEAIFLQTNGKANEVDHTLKIGGYIVKVIP